jgi:hypothetical protein
MIPATAEDGVAGLTGVTKSRPHRIPASQGGAQGPHSMVWYYLGGTTMFFFMVQSHRVLLLMYYQPGEARLRKHSLPDDQSAFRLVDASVHLLERASHDHLAGGAHVQHDDAEGLPPASELTGSRATSCLRSRWASAFPAICCPGTNWLSSRLRLGLTW